MTTNSGKKRAKQKAFRLTKKSAFKVAKKIVKTGLSFSSKVSIAGNLLDPIPGKLGDSTNPHEKTSPRSTFSKNYKKELALTKRVRNMKKKGSKK
tara:strand:- start:141 stop:425 length:285 start_codon:yes stop_codon:yes gene_type:complete